MQSTVLQQVPGLHSEGRWTRFRYITVSASEVSPSLLVDFFSRQFLDVPNKPGPITVKHATPRQPHLNVPAGCQPSKFFIQLNDTVAMDPLKFNGPPAPGFRQPAFACCSLSSLYPR